MNRDWFSVVNNIIIELIKLKWINKYCIHLGTKVTMHSISQIILDLSVKNETYISLDDYSYSVTVKLQKLMK